MAGLKDVTILVTTFLRDSYLYTCLEMIGRGLGPDVKVIVIDDGRVNPHKNAFYRGIEAIGHQYTYLPFDSGLPAKRNVGVAQTKTKYVLMGCDDFDFSTAKAKVGVEKLVKVLDENPDIDVAGGRHNNNPYEGFLTVVPGQYIKETRLVPDGTKEFYKVDLTVNYFLARTEVIRNYPWDERMKIGGEHGDWFLTLKEAGRNVVWVPGVNITEFAVPNGSDPQYGKYRARARELGHKIFLEKRGVVDYKGFE